MASAGDPRDGGQAVSGTRLLIDAYGAGGFRVAGTRFEGSILVAAARVMPWPVAELAAATPTSLDGMFAADTDIELLLLGCGLGGAMPPAGLQAALAARRVRIEAMSTGAACRTFNVLTAEKRPVAAALLAV
jgi:uncharacterized protein